MNRYLYFSNKGHLYDSKYNFPKEELDQIDDYFIMSYDPEEDQMDLAEKIYHKMKEVMGDTFRDIKYGALSVAFVGFEPEDMIKFYQRIFKQKLYLVGQNKYRKGKPRIGSYVMYVTKEDEPSFDLPHITDFKIEINEENKEVLDGYFHDFEYFHVLPI